MPFVDNIENINIQFRDKTAMEDLGNILEANGWTRIKHFYKVVVGREQYRLTPTETNLPYRAITMAVSKHLLYKNAKGRIMGMAEIITKKKSLTPKFEDAAGQAAYEAMLVSTFDTSKVKGLIYFYTVEKEPSMKDGEVSYTYPIKSLVGDQNYATALDVEIGKLTMFPLKDLSYTTPVDQRDMERDANVEEIKAVANPRVMQSPCVPVEMFITQTEEDSVDNVYSQLNKWDDSRITIQGRIDSNSVFLVMQSDASSNFTDNRVPTVPFFFGEVEIDSGVEDVYVMFGGATPPDAKYKFDTNTAYAGNSITKLVIPCLKAYPSYPGDGVNTGVISRTRGGARYQRVYLSWGTTSEGMPPSRETDGKQYPRSWGFPIKNYGLNPSKYSGSIHTSNVYVVHPEEGVVGKLRNLVGLQTYSTNNPELRIRRENCPVKVTDSYQCLTISAVAPVTKSPATPYFLAGIAVRKTVVGTPNYTDVPEPQDVTASLTDNILTVKWKIGEDFFHEGVSIDIDGVTVVPIVSGASRYEIDLSLFPELDGQVDTVGVTSINSKGKESNTVEIPL